MTTSVLPEFTISYTSRRRATVIDPALALSIYGLPIAKQLGDWMELWIVREFWYMLEGTLLQSSDYPQVTPSMERALQEWERLRQHVDNHHRPVNVLADVLGDSTLPSGSEPDLMWRWEALAQGLDQHLESRGVQINSQVMVSRDLVSLAAARSACIFTLRSPTDAPTPPPLCNALELWGIPCLSVAQVDALASIEAQSLRHLFVHAGLASLFWSGMDLCVLHLFVPAAATLGTAQLLHAYGYPGQNGEEECQSPASSDLLWDGAQAFWYSLRDCALALADIPSPPQT